MSRVDQERIYWNVASIDPEVDDKYICDIPLEDCQKELGQFKGKVLEIGCGVGRLLQPGYYGIDISTGMLAIAFQRKPECIFKVAWRDIPYENDFFDAVYSMLLFQHLKPDAVAGYIKESYRVLKKGGVFKYQFCIGDEREPFSNHYLAEEMFSWLGVAGFGEFKMINSNLNEKWRWIEAVK